MYLVLAAATYLLLVSPTLSLMCTQKEEVNILNECVKILKDEMVLSENMADYCKAYQDWVQCMERPDNLWCDSSPLKGLRYFVSERVEFDKKTGVCHDTDASLLEAASLELKRPETDLKSVTFESAEEARCVKSLNERCVNKMRAYMREHTTGDCGAINEYFRCFLNNSINCNSSKPLQKYKNMLLEIGKEVKMSFETSSILKNLCP
ncbi:predicted protein [Nematostella vectensis]|uniref:Uncharacterized protein n=1 Tax=Nematostella vectensis TaxID=45351 RepID=A7S3J3_NEMVE|nr:uncharacterized protein LOC125556811 [Nematostella vectensis]EDO41781.1 predicted protein [Nematostella vectensis]|eukprot:XP_001633844.1 predicted protein [Nematostella vectensis]